MRCNPARWLWGLIPIGMLTWICFQWEAPRIEADLAQRGSYALHQAGQGWATATFAGRDAVLSGLAAEGREPKAARETLRSVWGVRVVELRTDLAKRAETYVWSAAFGAGKLTLSGFVPSEEARKSVVALARSRFPKAAIEDGMVLAPGAALGGTERGEGWLDGVGFGLAQLSALKRGVVNLDGGALAVSGQAADPASYNAVRRALAEQAPKGLTMARGDITAPVVAPYTWSARLAARQLTLAGYGPSDAAREEIFARAKQLFPRTAIVDRSETGAGAPTGWMDAARLSLDVLRTLGDGSAELKDWELTLSGTGADKAAAAAAHNLVAENAPASFRIADAIGRQKTAATAARDDAAGAAAAHEAARQAALEADARSREEAYAASRRAAEAKTGTDTDAGPAPAATDNRSIPEFIARMTAYATARREAEVAVAAREQERDAGYEATRRAVEAEAASAKSARATTTRSTEEARLRDEGYAAARRAVESQAVGAKRGATATTRSDDEARLREAGFAAARRRADAQIQAAARAASELDAKAVADARIRDAGYAAARRRAETEAAARRAASQKVAAVDKRPQPKLSAEEQGCQDRLNAAKTRGTIRFETGSAELDRSSRPTLDSLANVANACPTVRIEIAGHTDSQGEADANRLLSERRAEAVRAYLIKDGVAADRLSAVGYGADRPAAPNDSDDNRARNRRIEFTVLAR